MSAGAVAALVRDDERLRVAATAAHIPVDQLIDRRVELLPGVLTNMTTEELARVRFGTGEAGPSIIVKIARSPRHSPLWAEIPAEFRPQVMVELPWRAEPDLYRSELSTLLPSGMRMPSLYAIDELDDDRVALWLEDVEERAGAWSRTDYRTAARSLGRLAGRLPESAVPSYVPVQRRDLRGYFFGRIMVGTLPTLRSDATWSHPLVAQAVDERLRADLEALTSVIPAVLDRLSALPYTFAHGDACPQNLLRPVQEATTVPIDWTFAGISPIGMDAGQLLAGHAESGVLDPADLPLVFEDILEAYLAGLRDEKAAISAADARYGSIGALVVRSAFTALPLELLASAQQGLPELFARRARYARFLVDLARELR